MLSHIFTSLPVLLSITYGLRQHLPLRKNSEPFLDPLPEE